MAALAELAPLVLALVCLALAAMATVLVEALMHPLIAFLESIPGIGGLLAYPFKEAVKYLLKALAKVESGVDHLIGIMYHLLAKQMDWLWREIKGHAALLGIVSPLLATVIYALHHLKGIVHGATESVKHVGSRLHRLEKEWHGIEHRVKTLEQKIAQGIGHDLRIRIKALEQEADYIEHSVVPGLRTGIRATEGEIASLKQWLGIKAGTRYLDWIAALGLAALAALGLDFLKCDSAKNMSRNRGCSTWGALDDLLGLLALGVAAAEFETLIHEAQDLTEGAVTVFDDVFGLSR